MLRALFLRVGRFIWSVSRLMPSGWVLAQFRRAWYFADDGFFFANKVYDEGSFYDE